jgi:hypothetical protein
MDWSKYLWLSTLLARHALEAKTLQVANYFGKKFAGQVTKHIRKKNLDLHDHLSDQQQTFIKLHFRTTTICKK